MSLLYNFIYALLCIKINLLHPPLANVQAKLLWLTDTDEGERATDVGSLTVYQRKGVYVALALHTLHRFTHRGSLSIIPRFVQ